MQVCELLSDEGIDLHLYPVIPVSTTIFLKQGMRNRKPQNITYTKSTRLQSKAPKMKKFSCVRYRHAQVNLYNYHNLYNSSLITGAVSCACFHRVNLAVTLYKGFYSLSFIVKYLDN